MTNFFPILISTLLILCFTECSSDKYSPDNVASIENLNASNDSLKVVLTTLFSKTDSLTKYDPIGMEIRKVILPLQWDIKEFYEYLENVEEDNIDYDKIQKNYLSIINGLLLISKDIELKDTYQDYHQILGSRMRDFEVYKQNPKQLLELFRNDIYKINIAVLDKLFSDTISKKNNKK